MKKLFSISLIALLFFMVSSSYSQVTVTPGPATNYATLKAAFDAINAGTHGNGAIAVSINANTTEVDSATLNGGVFTSCSVMPTATVSVTMTTNHPAIYLNGADNVTIDGRIGGTGSTRSLSIINYVTITTTSTTQNNVACVAIANGATNNIVRYTRCFGAANQQITTTAAAGGRLILITLSLPGTGGNNDNIVEFNDIQGGARGIQCFGTMGTVSPYTTFYSNDNNIIRNNLVRNARNIPIFCGSAVNGITVDQNEVTQDSALTFTAATAVTAIQNQSAGTVNITRNWIHDWHTTMTTGLTNQYRGMIALPVWLTAAGFTPVTTINISNNMISLFTNNTNGTFTGGIQTQFSSTASIGAPFNVANYSANVYHNTINMGGTTGAAIGGFFECFVANVITPTTGQVYSLNYYNNICRNSRTGGTGYHVGSDIDSNAILTTNADYNLNLSSGANGFATAFGSFIYPNGAIVAYKDNMCMNIPPTEQHTEFKNVNFVSNQNLHLAGPVGGDLNGKPGLKTIDFNGASRSALYPYRGCDEGAALRVFTMTGCLEEKVADGEVLIGLYNGCALKSTSSGYFDVNTNTCIVTFGDSIASATAYDVRVVSKNHLESWAASTVSFSPNASYSFPGSGIYGGNQTGSGCFLAGDVNQDSIIDGTDMIDIYNEIPLVLTGCRLQNDANSDEIVDATDMIVTYNNIPGVWFVASPCPEPSNIPSATEVVNNKVVRKSDFESINSKTVNTQ